MGRIFKWLLSGVVLIGLVAATLAGIVFVVMLRSVPADNGTARIAGLGEVITVLFDREGIAHIEAQTLLGASKVLGYIHARDRLWQMEILRMAGQGRLSEIFGKKTLASDLYLRTLGLAGNARKSHENLLPETRAILEAYADGVNAYQHRKTARFKTAMPPEFLILGHTPEPWEAWHSGLVLKVMALTLEQNSGREIKRLALASKGFSPREIEDVIPYGSRNKPAALPDLRSIFAIGGKSKSGSTRLDSNTLQNKKPNPVMWPTGKSASNNWVISGSRTTSGKPILANDPHLGLSAPSTFYLVHVSFMHEGVRRNVIGGSLPGTPLVLVGRNDRVAWGLTSTGLDSQDLFVERINPDNPDEYLTPDGWRAFESIEETILISGEAPHVFTRRLTRHGPVLPDDYRGLKQFLPAGHVAALKWTALIDDDTTLDAAVGIIHSRTVQEYITAMRPMVSPMQSIVVADLDGNIALVAPGRIPLRKPENLIAGRAPVPGWENKYDWQGFLPFSAAPRIVNPASGALATANGNFLAPGYPHHITHDWAEPFRQNRVEQLVIGENSKHTIQRSREIMADKHSAALLRLRSIAFETMAIGSGSGDGMLAALQSWDGEMAGGQPEPLIMLAWFRHLHRAILEDDLGEAYKLFQSGRISVVLQILETSGARNWCDRAGTTKLESCEMILRDALDAAIRELTQLQGKNWRKWRYGAAHVAVSEHRPFANVGLLANFFNVEISSNGGPYTLLRGQTNFSKPQPYRNRSASVYRAIYDFADLDNSLFIQSTGQSGHFMSRFYRSFSKRWADVEFVSMTTKRADYKAGATGTWKFMPPDNSGIAGRLQ